MVDAGAMEMLRQTPAPERAPQRPSEAQRPTHLPTRNPGQEAADAARMNQLQQFLRQEAPGVMPTHHDLPAKPTANTPEQTQFNLTRWFKDVFDYLTNNMFQKKR